MQYVEKNVAPFVLNFVARWTSLTNFSKTSAKEIKVLWNW